MNRSNSPLSLKLPPPRCAVLLVNITAGMKLAYAFSMSDLCSIPVSKTLAKSRSLNIRFIGSKTMLHDRSPYYMFVVGAICRDFPATPSSKSSVMAPSQRHCWLAERCPTCGFNMIIWGFPWLGYPHGWMVYFMENPNSKKDDNGGTPMEWKPSCDLTCFNHIRGLNWLYRFCFLKCVHTQGLLR